MCRGLEILCNLRFYGEEKAILKIKKVLKLKEMPESFTEPIVLFTFVYAYINTYCMLMLTKNT